MPGGDDQLLIAMSAVQAHWPAASYVIGGRGLTSRIRSQPGIGVCDRVSDVIGTVDALVKRADLN